ncbi:MAG: hypothetical protein WBP72_11660 [Rhodocyclaceae bacterium]
MTAVLSFEQAPPLSVPFRFFLTAPLFGCLAGLLLAFDAEAVLVSRWSGASLALTHLLTLGFMLQAMCGALLQLLPVVVGANVWRPRWVGAVTHVGLIAGTFLLAAGFLTSSASWFQLAIPTLGATVSVFVLATAIGLLRTPSRSETLSALRMSIVALSITAGLGIALSWVFGWQAQLPVMRLAQLHVAWGFLGWGLVLLVGVSFLVVPMFQLTPPYAKRFAGLFPLVLTGTLVLWSATVFAAEDPGWETWVPVAALGGLAIAFAVQTLRLQAQRRRRHVDPTFLFWRTAMFALVIGTAMVLVRMYLDDEALGSRLEMAAGAMIIVGFFLSVINGMFYKIVPFLIWMHLQRIVKTPPNMSRVISETAMRRQLWLHWAALAALVLGWAVTPLLALGGILLAASCVWTEVNLVRAVRVYRRSALAG